MRALDNFIKKRVAAKSCVKPETLQSGITKLRILTESVDFSELTGKQESTELEVEDGYGYIVRLMKKPEIAVARVVLSKGSSVAKHTHKEWEIMLIYKGHLILKVQEKQGSPCKEIDLKATDHYYLESGVQHSAFAAEDTSVIVVTIPASPAFP